MYVYMRTVVLYKTTVFIEDFQLQYVPYILHTADFYPVCQIVKACIAESVSVLVTDHVHFCHDLTSGVDRLQILGGGKTI